MGNPCCNNSPYTQSSESKMRKDGNRLLEMKVDRDYEDHLERRDGEEVVLGS